MMMRGKISTRSRIGVEKKTNELCMELFGNFSLMSYRLSILMMLDTPTGYIMLFSLFVTNSLPILFNVHDPYRFQMEVKKHKFIHKVRKIELAFECPSCYSSFSEGKLLHWYPDLHFFSV